MKSQTDSKSVYQLREKQHKFCLDLQKKNYERLTWNKKQTIFVIKKSV